MAAQASGASPAEAPTIEALIKALDKALDPEVRAAIDDVDRTLIALSLQQSPWNRLRSASTAADPSHSRRRGRCGSSLDSDADGRSRWQSSTVAL
jgi:hypothetical protein